MAIKPEDNPAEGERKLEYYNKIGEAARFLQKSPVVPAALLFRLYGVNRIDRLSDDQLEDLIGRGKAGKLFLGLDRR